MTATSGSTPEPPDGSEHPPTVGSFSRVAAKIRDFFDGVGKVVGAWLALFALVGGVVALAKGDGEESDAATVARHTLVYKQGVGDICAALNREARDANESNRTLASRLSRARTTLEQRNVLLHDQTLLVRRSNDLRAHLQSLNAPTSLHARHRETADAWEHALRQQSTYTQRLDHVRTRQDLLNALELLRRSRPTYEHASQNVRVGLLALGDEQCDLERPEVTNPVTLPDLPRRHSDPPAERSDPPAPSDRPATSQPPRASPTDGGPSATTTPTPGAADVTPNAAPPPPPASCTDKFC